MSFDIKTMQWLNPPEKATWTARGVIVETKDASDFWQKTYYGFTPDSGHFLSTPRNGDFTVEVSFSGQYETLYDQAGLMLRVDETHWVKCGVEYTDGHMHFSTVVTNDHSDWSVVMLKGEPKVVSARITRLGDALFIQYSIDEGKSWSMARLAWFSPSPETVQVGLMTCSPKRAGFRVEFFDFKLTDPVSREIH
ncbi:DUF1349 domain-containing protein [Rhizobium oryziradicis]|uniref:Regulation of enolase 1 n=1 Tax=Rhizobium oryziradicis TaxID=1867956 RepID=A0A1Q8ZQN3_9HYPH|nr:DUF1349 domain-containing protein [Rhizobium oryziradicis]OLP44383.1 hypothetical protein BJF95_07550 [Rhizobium oryziradicis]